MHVGIANPRWQGKRSQLSRRMRNTGFCPSGKQTHARVSAAREESERDTGSMCEDRRFYRVYGIVMSRKK